MLSVVTWEGWRHTRCTLIRVNLWNLFFSYSLHSTKNEPLLDRPQGLCVCGENVGCRAQLKNTILQSVWIKACITHKCSNIRSYILSCIHTNTRIMGERFIYKTLFSAGLMWCYLIWDVMRAKHKRFFYCHRHSSINEKNTEVPKMAVSLKPGIQTCWMVCTIQQSMHHINPFSTKKPPLTWSGGPVQWLRDDGLPQLCIWKLVEVTALLTLCLRGFQMDDL